MPFLKLLPLYWLMFILMASGPSAAQKKMCSKIFFQNINEEVMPWVQVEGVYDLFSENNGFPVYLNRPSSLFFYYVESKTQDTKVFVFGQKVGEIFGLAGTLSSDFNPKTWLSSGSLNKDDLFGDIVTKWVYYYPISKAYKTVQGPPYIKAICVDDEYFRCDSGNVYFNDTITGSQREILNDPRVDYFAKIPGVYTGTRPVYQHNRQKWYLYYRDGYWFVGSSYSGQYGDYFRVQDFALRPEYITRVWENWTGERWTSDSGLRIKCRGITNGENKCYGDSLCNGRGTCVYTAGNETVCLCADMAYGASCEKRDLCSDPGVPRSSISVVNTGKSPGDIATSFCVAGYTSSPVEFYICEQRSGKFNWLLESKKSCQVPRPITDYPHPNSQGPPPPGPGNPTEISPPADTNPLDRSDGFMIFVIAFFACHIVGPTFIWLGVFLFKIARCCSSTQVGTPERLEAVRKIGNTRYVLFVRTFSAFYNLAFWVWLCSVCACLSRHQRGNNFSFLFYWAVVMCAFCVVFVAIEAFFSVERKGLSHMVSWKYIQSLRSTPPLVTMQIERYNWQNYRYAVYTTNQATGRLEYDGTREGSRKVGRKFRSEPFIYSSWTDESKQDFHFDSQLIRLKIRLDVTLEGAATQFFEAQKFALVEKTQHLNVFYDFERKDSVPNHHSDVVLCPNSNSVPFWINESFFWCATFLQLSWLYRWLFISCTRPLKYTLIKKVFCDDSLGSNIQTGSQQVLPGNRSGQTGFQQVDATTTNQDAENDAKQPLVQGNHNNRNYMSV